MICLPAVVHVIWKNMEDIPAPLHAGGQDRAEDTLPTDEPQVEEVPDFDMPPPHWQEDDCTPFCVF